MRSLLPLRAVPRFPSTQAQLCEGDCNSHPEDQRINTQVLCNFHMRKIARGKAIRMVLRIMVAMTVDSKVSFDST